MIILSAFIIGMAGNSISQNSEYLANRAGLYITPGDFVIGKLNYVINCSDKNTKMRTSQFLNSGTIKIIKPDTIIKVLKSQIWGYRLCNGKEYRIYHGKEYLVLERGPIPIYEDNEVTHSNPKTNRSITRTMYFFSENAEGPIKKLKLPMIETAFITNVKFHELIDLYFKSDEELSKYDEYYKMFQLNYFYLKSLK